MNLNLINNWLSSVIDAPVFCCGEDNASPNTDTSELLCELFNSIELETSIFKSDDEAGDTHCVLNMVSSGPLSLDNRKIANENIFVAEIRTKNRNESFLQVAKIKQKIESSHYALEITDWLQDFDKASESFRQNLEITFTVPRSNLDATVPAVLIYEVDTQGENIETRSRPRQALTERFVVLLMTNGNNYSELKEAIKHALIGWSLNEHYEPLKLNMSHPLETTGNMRMYRFEFESQCIFRPQN